MVALNSIAGLDPLDGPSPAVTTQDVSRHCQMFPWGPNRLQVRITILPRVLYIYWVHVCVFA